MELLREGRERELTELVSVERRALRPLSGRLYDAEPELRARAARALGELAAAHEDLGREFIRRTLWGLNDESATNGGPAIIALGEIGRRAPRLLAPFVEPLAAFAWDDGLRVSILEALTKTAEAAPELVAPLKGELARNVDSGVEAEREALAALEAALGGTPTHDA